MSIFFSKLDKIIEASQQFKSKYGRGYISYFTPLRYKKEYELIFSFDNFNVKNIIKGYKEKNIRTEIEEHKIKIKSKDFQKWKKFILNFEKIFEIKY